MLVHREERRQQYVAVGGVGDRRGAPARYDRPWQEWGSGGSGGRAGMRVGKGAVRRENAGHGRWSEQRNRWASLGTRLRPRVSAARAAQSDVCAERARGMRCSGLSQDAHPRTT